MTSSSLLVQALECALKCVFLDSDWSFLGNNLFVHSGFARDDERNHLCALVVVISCVFLHVFPRGDDRVFIY